MRQHLACLLVLTGLLSGCPDEGTSGTDTGSDTATAPDVVSDVLPDVQGDIVDVRPGDADVPDVSRPELPDTDTVQPVPTLSMWFATLDQDATTGTLYPSDDVYPAEGMQIDIFAAATNVPDGQIVTLFVAGMKVADEPITQGGVSFARVEMPDLMGLYLVRAELKRADGERAEATKTVAINTRGCPITVDVPQLDGGGGCLTDDDDATDGLQVRLNVTLESGICTGVDLTVDDGTGPRQLSASFSDGVASVLVDVVAQPAEGTLSLGANAPHPDSESLDGQATGSWTYDFLVPELALTAPDGDVLNTTNDEDPAAAGIQTDVAGTAIGLPDGEEVGLYVDEVLVASVAPVDGTFLFDNVTFGANGVVTIRVSAADGCGNVGTASTSVDVFALEPQVALTAPAAGTTLFAKDDGDPQTEDSYELTATVELSSGSIDDVVVVECRPSDGPDTVWFTTGSHTVSEQDVSSGDALEIAVVLSVGTLGQDAVCRAAYQGVNSATSAPAGWTIGLPAPALNLVEPADGFMSNTTDIEFCVEGTHLDGQAVVVSLVGAGGTVVTSVTTSGVITDGLLCETLALGANDGTYLLRVDATDTIGNQVRDLQPAASLESSLTIDTISPVLVLIAPSTPYLDPTNNPAHVDENPTKPGYQTTFTFRLTNESVVPGAEICATIGGSNLGCQQVDAGFQASWGDVDLLPGDNNPVVVTGGDAFGNAAAPLSLAFNLNLDQPLVQIIAPQSGLVTADSTVDVTVKVSEPDSGQAIVAATVVLENGGVAVGVAATNVGDGTYTFSGVPLEAGANGLQALAEFSGEEGFSQAVTVTYKTTTPEIAVTAPLEGAVLNLASAECLGQQQDCVLSVGAAVSNAEAGSPATLTVNCGAGDTIYDATVGAAPSVSFDDVVLAHGGSCTLTPSVTDAASQVGDGSAVSVTVDRVAPIISAFVSPAGAYLIYSSDVAPLEPGLQHPLQLNVQGLEAGRIVSVIVDGEGEDPPALTAEVTADTPDGSNFTASFGNVTFPPGDVVIRVEFSDAAGNVGGGEKAIAVQPNTSVRLLTPTFPGQSCEAGCGANALCDAGQCWHKWGSSFVAQGGKLTVATAGIIGGTDNLRVCSDHPSLAATAATCASGGGSTYYEVLILSGIEGNQQLNVSPLLPVGFQTLVAELRPAPDAAWLSSLDDLQPSVRNRRVLLDLQAPTVSVVASPSDANSDDFLNAAEANGDGSYVVSVTADEDGQAEIFANSDSRGSGTVSGGNVTVNVMLDPGANAIYARVTDRVGNTSAVPAPAQMYTPFVDKTAPTVAFTSPPAGSAWIKANGPTDATVTVGLQAYELAETVIAELFDGIVPSGTQEVTGGGVTFTGSLAADGAHTLTVLVTDPAGNETIAATTPTTVTTDRAAPTAAITAPTDGATITVDANVTKPGFQVMAEFTVGEADHATSWTLEIADCDDTFAACGAFSSRATGVDTGETPQNVEITVATNELNEYRRLRLTATDEAGNVSVSDVDFGITVTGCVVGFQGLPASGWFNLASCDSGGAPSCSVVLAGQVTGVCAGLGTEVDLYDGTTVLGTETVDGAGAVSFTLSATDGATLDLQLKARIGQDEAGSSAIETFAVDLTPPTALLRAATVDGFTTPGPGASEIYNALDDQAADAGFQMPALVAIVDANAAGGALVQVAQDDADSPGNPAVLCAGAGCNVTSAANGPDLDLTVRGLTLPDLAKSTVTFTVRDAAFNEATTAFEADVDLIAPAAVVIDGPSVVLDTRRPAVSLAWSATGDDGTTGTAAEYDIRYSRNPIDADNFAAACSVSDLAHAASPAAPAVAGTPETYDVTGPDPRSPGDACRFQVRGGVTKTWHFAVRASDANGNWSPLTAASIWSTDGLNFSAHRIVLSDTFATDVLGGNLTRRDAFTLLGSPVGDVDGDGFDDVVTGSLDANGFCVFYGAATLPATWTIDTAQSTVGLRHDCILGAASVHASPTASALAAYVAGLGDVNGDGYADFGVSGKIDSNFAFLVVYLGADGGPVLASPNVTINGILSPFGGYFSFCGAGNFTGATSGSGEPISSIGVGMPAGENVIVLSGDATWDAVATRTTPVTLDAAALGGHPSLTVSTDGFRFFGIFCNGAGDILDTPAPNAATLAGEILISNAIGDNQLFIIPGRPLAGAESTTVTFAPPTMPTGEDANIVRVLQEGAGARAGFPSSFSGLADFTGDGIPEVLAGHSSRSPSFGGDGKTIYLFDGAALRAGVGTAMRIQADPTPVGDGAYTGVNGWIVATELIGNPNAVRSGGDFDGWQNPGATPDLVYGTGSGAVLRFNHEDTANGLELGMFPWADHALSNPEATGGSVGAWSVGAQFTGDAAPDVVLGTATGEIVIIR